MGTRSNSIRLIALCLTVFALAVPAIASASPVPALGTYDTSEQDSTAVYLDAIARGSGQPTSQATPSSGTTVSPTASGAPDPGFSWGDAALGASAMLAIGIVAAGSAMFVRSYRHSHTQIRMS
jgi:hypothetical protein